MASEAAFVIASLASSASILVSCASLQALLASSASNFTSSSSFVVVVYLGDSEGNWNSLLVPTETRALLLIKITRTAATPAAPIAVTTSSHQAKPAAGSGTSSENRTVVPSTVTVYVPEMSLTVLKVMLLLAPGERSTCLVSTSTSFTVSDN